MRIQPTTLAIVMLLLAAAGCQSTNPERQPATGGGGAPHAAAVGEPAPADPWYEREIRAYEEADRRSPPVRGAVLFVGSSSIRMWKTLADDMRPMTVLNRGFGGSKTREVLAVYDRIVRPYAPCAIVYYCGDNDLGTDNTDSQAAADGFIAFDRRARADWPGIPVFYIPIKPSLARWGNWGAMARANEMVRAYCERTPGATYIDTVSPTLTPAGAPNPAIFMDDGLHLNAKGYALWTAEVRPLVLEAWHARRK